MIYRMLTSLVISLSLASGVIGSASANSTIVVGGKKFTEQQLVAEMTAQLLRANGYKVDKRADWVRRYYAPHRRTDRSMCTGNTPARP